MQNRNKGVRDFSERTQKDADDADQLSSEALFPLFSSLLLLSSCSSRYSSRSVGAYNSVGLKLLHLSCYQVRKICQLHSHLQICVRRRRRRPTLPDYYVLAVLDGFRTPIT